MKEPAILLDNPPALLFHQPAASLSRHPCRWPRRRPCCCSRRPQLLLLAVRRPPCDLVLVTPTAVLPSAIPSLTTSPCPSQLIATSPPPPPLSSPTKPSKLLPLSRSAPLQPPLHSIWTSQQSSRRRETMQPQRHAAIPLSAGHRHLHLLSSNLLLLSL